MDNENDKELDPELELELKMKVHRIMRYEKELKKTLFEIKIYSSCTKIFDWELFLILLSNHFCVKMAILGFVFDIVDLLGSFFNETLNTFIREDTFNAIFLLFFVVPVLFSAIIHIIATFIDTISFYFTSKKKLKKAKLVAGRLQVMIKIERESLDDMQIIIDKVINKKNGKNAPPQNHENPPS